MKYALVLMCSLWSAILSAEAQISDAYVRGLIPGRDMSAGFFTFKNSGDQPIVLVGASSAAAERVEFHTSLHEDGMMKMRALENVTVAPGESVTFAPGGNHLMLFGCDEKVFAAGHVMLNLQSAAGESFHLHMPVMSAKSAHSSHSMNH